MNGPIVFLDTETTGLSLDDDIWEFAAIRREEDGTERTVHLFLQHSTLKCQQLPERFRIDHERRFPNSHISDWHPDALKPWAAANIIAPLFDDHPHIVGAVPNFDTERIARLLVNNGHKPGWHYHLIDVENLAVGWLCGTRLKGSTFPQLPWDSDDISRACGVEPPAEEERHTALGDARWAMRLYDAITGVAS